MNILICGGAGYIGSHMAKMLAKEGHGVTVFDNLSTGHRQAVQWGELVQGDLLNIEDLRKAFAGRSFEAVMHFSARSIVSESVNDPALYYSNNVSGTLNLLKVMLEHQVNKIIFSSTAATYGMPVQELIDESHPQEPINPYGASKLMVERMLKDFGNAHGLRSVSLRYFNAAGADPDGEIGEAHDPETHLIPNVLKSLLEKGKGLKIFGSDYPTKDGTCVRDYIHIYDLCRAHLLALNFINDRSGAHFFNLGNGTGYSILEILQAASKVTGQEIPYTSEERRSGDPATLVAESSLARSELGWTPKHGSIEEIIETAWHWHKAAKF